MEYIHYIDSPLGRILISGEDDSLTGLWFEGQKYFADTIRKDAEVKHLPVFAETERWLEIYFEGKIRGSFQSSHPRVRLFRRRYGIYF
jgi:methylated-DNA-[protein]-cysteine S-methyltransferase